jgi:hypothetical protein
MRSFLIGIICVVIVLLAPVRYVAQATKQEIDAAKILWHSHTNAMKYFGIPTKVLPPESQADGWDYQYKGGSETVGTKNLVLLFSYRYKKRPKNIQEALEMVGLATSVRPFDFGPTYIWSSKGQYPRPMRFKGKILNRVILFKDFSEIAVDGHDPGAY